MASDKARSIATRLQDVLAAAIVIHSVDDADYRTMVDELFDEVGEDQRILFALLYALAYNNAVFVRHAHGLSPLEVTPANLVFVGPDGRTDPADVPLPRRIALQFLTAGMNEDRDTAHALWSVITGCTRDEVSEFTHIVWDSTIAAGRAWSTAAGEARR